MSPFESAVDNVCFAWKNAGIRPEYHRAQMEHLRGHWPTLYYALRDLVDAEEKLRNDMAYRQRLAEVQKSNWKFDESV